MNKSGAFLTKIVKPNCNLLFTNRNWYSLYANKFNPGIDYHKTLGVTKQSSDEQIRSAFLVKAKQFHPDINPKFQQQFKTINQAYRVLTDPKIKKQYLRSRENFINSNQSKQQVQSTQKNGNNESDPFADLYRTNMKYLNIKNKQYLNTHISKQYSSSSKREQQYEQQKKNNSSQKMVKYLIGFSSLLTSIIFIEMVGKYFYRNRNNKTKDNNKI